MTERLAIDAIVIGERVRRDMGDIAGLAESMKRHGLLHPVVVKSDRTLIAGQRRLEAARLNGWKDVPVTVIDVEDLLSAERDENTERKNFTPTEAVAIKRLITEANSERIRAQRKHASDVAHGKTPSGKSYHLANGVDSIGPSRDIAARVTGHSTASLSRAEEVVREAERDPETFGDLPGKMDAGGNITGVHRELKRRKAGAKPDRTFTGKREKRGGFRKDKTAPFSPDSKRQREVANGQKRRMVSTLSIVSGCCQGLRNLDVPMAASVCDSQEVKAWARKARDAAKTLRGFAEKLERRASK